MKYNILICLILFGCKSNFTSSDDVFYIGGDLSYVNEMMDCGAIFRSNGEEVNVYEFFGTKGSNIARFRLWHNPSWTNYSNYQDVEKAISQAKKHGMDILLDFHYSDTWADPQQQVIPQAWEEISEISVLKDSLYNYTYSVLNKLYAKGLAPEFVQVGNETNIEILQQKDAIVVDTINWSRNLMLLNAGIQAITDFSLEKSINIKSMIHIAQPENALWWFAQAAKYGIESFDIIGVSYYPKWSAYGLDSLGVALDSLKSTYKKDVMIVETAYPYTLQEFDSAPNILGEDALIPGFPATPTGQYDFFKKLINITKASGGQGVIYWEPGWVSTDCKIQSGQGSGWENAAFFDAANNNEALEIFNALK